ncbi:MAG: F0F1 ATP synthase subunit delta [Thiotrichales bacterium]|nr:F0F1 ATP synthase subunit delta [Thiotrichales bacterium]MBT3614087.1 F0F1 ATP synthase subunit delta [Thiotrichales bacterium]MBT3752581.1 F0F1 ATP synthase subunit delta [Thiotrichales bacterium]MBT3837228.1 F0F1 ATP synthase subunit delta [Thiotrichales bacterium]MBT4151605.1 F0F1 ATP synthase subunit delta [Thiotrichales bacterium]
MSKEARTTIARPYAEAIYAQAVSESAVDLWSETIDLLAIAVQDSEVAVRLNHPRFSQQQMTELILGLDSKLLSENRENFVKVLIESSRLGYAPEIKALFDKLRAADDNRLDVEVTSAYQLDDMAQEQIIAALAAEMGREINMTTEIDETLIGGVIVHAGDQVIDLSVRGRVEQLAGVLQS